MYVPAEPILDLGLLVGKSRHQLHELIAPWGPPRVIPFASCRSALWGAFRALRLAPGDRVLVPAYIFHTVLHPAAALGVESAFYRVDRSLAPDVEDVAARIDARTKAVLLVHYFGFPGPAAEMRQLCDEHGIALIEDCAHALFSTGDEGPMGSFGDVSIFSLKKPLAVPGGGALVINSPDVSFGEALRRPPSTETFRLLSLRALNFAETVSGWSVKASILSSHGMRRRIARRERRVQTSYDYRLGTLSSHMARRVDPDEVVRRRRANYKTLFDGLAELNWIRPVYDRLPDGVSPFCFAAYVANRDGIQDSLLRKGVHARVYWDSAELPAGAVDECPEIGSILADILILPVHQDVSHAHALRIVEALRAAWQAVAT